MNRLILLLALAILSLAAFGLVMADDNLCYDVWAGQCQTQRQWEAGWCYANAHNTTCAALYPDIQMQSNGGNANSGNSSGASTESVGGQSVGAGQAQTGQSGQQQNSSGQQPNLSSQSGSNCGQTSGNDGSGSQTSFDCNNPGGTLPDDTGSGEPEETPTPDPDAPPIPDPGIIDEPSGE